MLKTLEEIEKVATGIHPQKLSVLCPEDKEFMLAIKKSWQRGYIEPILIGNQEKMNRVAHEVEFDISRLEKIFEEDRETIANLAITMLFEGQVDMVSKGQIPTSYVYRAIIKEESKAKTSKAISVISLWEIQGLNRLVAVTDTGVNIKPDYQKKIEIIKNAVFLLHLFEYPRPKVCVLSGQREMGDVLDSYEDAVLLRNAAAMGDLGNCEIIAPTSFSEIFLNSQKHPTYSSAISADLSKMPDVLLAPHLDAGNILAKIDFILPVTRRSLVLSSKGPIVIPSRADISDSIIGEIAVGVVVADRIKGQ